MEMENTLTVKRSRRRMHLSTYLLALFFVLLPFEFPLASFGVGSILRYAGIAVMGLVVVDILMDNGKIHFDYRCILLVLWIVLVFASELWAADEEGFSQFSGIYFRNALMFLLVCLIRYEERELHFLCKAFMLGLVLLLIYMTFVPGAVMYSAWQNRLTLVTDDKDGMDQNYLAAVISLPFGLFFYDLVNGKRQPWTRVAELVVCAACVYYVFATGSRTGLLELTLIAIFCLGANWKKNLALSVTMVVLLFLLIPLLIEALPEDLTERFSLDALTGQTEESGSRLRIWKAAVQAIVDGNWLLGYGAGSSETVIGRYLAVDSHVHNYYLAHILELGLMGFGLFTTMGVKMVLEVFRSRYRRVAVSFLGIVVTTLLLDVLTTKFFWSGMMLMSVAISVGRNKLELSENGAGKTRK